ncbi:MAG: hypothetical protein SA339_10555 [Methanomassiliicoccus sp.]|nr:hypothetical protein [Methanomassiliicoccus sp.]
MLEIGGGPGGDALSRKAHRPAGDRRGMGGFYEAIMAMMIVTSGIVLLTCSFTFLAVDGREEDALDGTCQDVLASILSNRTLATNDHMLDHRKLERADWSSLRGAWDGGLAVMLTLPDGSTTTLFRDDAPLTGERSARSEPINLVERGGEVGAGLLTVWVWR